MGLQCSILGHAFEDAGVERERTEQGSEVVTTEREIERCRRCGKERVVSESTEVAAVVDASDVDIETDETEMVDDAADVNDTAEATSEEIGGGLSGAIERSEGEEDAETAPFEGEASSGSEATARDTAEDLGGPEEESAPADPGEEDAEILTDDDSERNPGEWPDDTEQEADETEELTEPPSDPEVEERSLSGITVPEGEIVCPECAFRVEANSGYRAGDPCPNCNAWLEAERNQ